MPIDHVRINVKCDISVSEKLINKAHYLIYVRCNIVGCHKRFYIYIIDGMSVDEAFSLIFEV